VEEATDLFSGIRQELEALGKPTSDNTLQILAVKVSTQTVQKRVSVLSKTIDEVNKAMAAITTSLKTVPSRRDLQCHGQTKKKQIQ
jgi:hypothetical protein